MYKFPNEHNINGWIAYSEDVLSFWTRLIHIFHSIKGFSMNNKWTINMNYRCELMEANIIQLGIGLG